MRLADLTVSLIQAEIRVVPGAAWEVVDLGSRNGTVVDGAELVPGTPVAVEPDVNVVFGQVRCALLSPESARRAAATLAATARQQAASGPAGADETPGSTQPGRGGLRFCPDLRSALLAALGDVALQERTGRLEVSVRGGARWVVTFRRGQPWRAVSSRGERGLTVLQALLTLEEGFYELTPLQEVSGVREIDASLGELLLELQRQEGRSLRQALGNAELGLRLAQRGELIGQLAAGVSHDLNNLLTVVSGCAELLEHPGVSAARRDALVRSVRGSARSASDLARRLLRLSQGQRVASAERVELSDVVADTVGLLKHVMPPRVELRLEPAAAPAWVRVDRGQLEQVVLNLALNARDAMPRGGTLAFGVSRTADDRAQLTVRDTGHGMEAATRARIFEPFFSTKGGGANHGLGLAVVLGIVENQGGRVRVESAPGEGTTFFVELPQASDEDAARPALRTGGATGELVLYEPHPEVREVLGELLQLEGFDVASPATWEEALEELARRPDARAALGGPGAPAWVAESERAGVVVLSDAPLEHEAAAPTFVKPYDLGRLLEALRRATT